MNITPFFIAQRILLSHVYQKSISTMTIICYLGIFVGSFSLALITAIMNGFETVIHEKMQGIHSPIIIQSYGNDIDVDVLNAIIKKEFPDIIGISPSASHHILLRSKATDENMPTVALLKGIDPDKEQLTSSLAKKIISHDSHAHNFVQLFTDNHLIIGKQLARNNDIAIGDAVELLFIREEKIHGKKITFDSQNALISGIFDTGIDEFDNGVVYCSLAFLEQLYPNIPIEHINVSLSAHVDEKEMIQKLRNRLGIDVFSWQDLYPSLVASLKLEKYVSFFILALILLVASMNIMSLLFMHILQKRPMIAVLQSMGLSHQSLSILFFMIGITISTVACISGLLAAVVASYALQKYPFIQLPDTYYTTHLPVAMNWYIIIAVFGVVMIFGACATWLPIQRIRKINISRVLRFEG
jgi:lipoprotein-releasing system permease protein